jgi:elongator complex protein 2
VKFHHGESLELPVILSGSVDKTIRIWSVDRARLESTRTVLVVADLEGAVNTIAVAPGSGLFAAGSTDAKVRIWKLVTESGSLVGINLLQTLTIAPRFFPLALALSAVPAAPSSCILAVGGTRNIIQTYVAHVKDDNSLDFTLQATLTGHEGWVRALAFAQEKGDAAGDLLLASASQDKYIRLWRVHHGQELPPASAAGTNTLLGPTEKSLSNKAHRFEVEGLAHSLTFEALLLGHDDWVYSVCWRQSGAGLQLLSASADGSLAIWHCDASSGVWICLTRLGEVGAQKGATTATGSTGGYWIGLWSPSGSSVASLGRTGGWRLWHYVNDERGWRQAVAVSGHVKPVTGIAWAPDGRYLLSTR